MTAPLPVPRPSTRAKQARTISAARRLFLERGYLGTSMDAVALEARVSKQTLYVYYPSKEELFAAVLRELTVERSGQPVQLPPDLARPRDLQGLRRALRAAAGAGLARATDADHAATLLVGALVLRILRDGLLVPPGAAVPPSPEQLDDLVERFLLGVAPRSGSMRSRASG